jgi:hypothetical protein
MRRGLITVVIAVGAIFGAGPAAAASIDCSKVIPVVPDQFPAWGESGGWADPSQYTTIQLADIDGDGRAEMIGRIHGGLVTSRFDADTGTWITINGTPGFGDGSGFSDPSLYGTMQLADIDGQPGAELLARSNEGFYTLGWDKASSTWQTLHLQPGLLDSSIWAKPSGYSTIQFADIDGQPGAELVARQPGAGGGMREWKWVGGQWSALGEEATNSDANGWDAPEHYATLRFADIDGEPGAEMVGRGTEGLETRTWNRATNKWVPLNFSPLTHVWGTPDKYLTIQLGDIDGNGRAELVGRGGGGIESFSWDIDSKQWTRLGGEDLGLTDAAGWQDASHYSTIRLANVTGDRGAELLYRTASGLNVAKFDEATSNWSPLTSAPLAELGDAEGFNLPQSYMTIHAANVMGSQGQEIVARSPEGIETFKAATPAATSFEPTLEPGFNDLTSDPKEADAYLWVGQHAFVSSRTDDVRSKYPNQLWKDQWLGAARQLKTLLDAGQTPDSLDPAAFKTVATQLETEFVYVDYLNTWSAQVDDLFNKIFADKIFDVIRVPALMNLPVEGNNSETIMEVVALIGAFVESLADLAGPPGEVAGVVAGLVETSMHAALAASGEPPNIDSTVAELEADLQTENQRAQDANGCVQQAFAQSWGLLKALGEPIAAGQLTWEPTITPAMAAAAQRGYELVLWQTLTPVKWGVTASHGDNRNYVCGIGTDGVPHPYPARNGGLEYWKWFPAPAIVDRQVLAWFIQDRNCSTAPPREALSEVLDPPNPDGTGPLGVPIEPVLCGVDGWRVPGSSEVGQDWCPQPWGYPGTKGQQRGAQAAKVRSAAQRQAGVALTQIRGLQATLPAEVKNRQTRRALLATLRQVETFARLAHTTGIQTYADMAEETLRIYTSRLDAQVGRRLPKDVARRHAEAAFAIRGMLAGRRGGRPPRARISRARVAVDASGSAAIRVQCPRGSVRPCTGVLRVLRGKRVVGRHRFAIRPGATRRVEIRLSESFRRMLARHGRLRVTAQATTAHPSGKEANSTRRLVLRASVR